MFVKNDCDNHIYSLIDCCYIIFCHMFCNFIVCILLQPDSFMHGYCSIILKNSIDVFFLFYEP